MKRKNFEDEHEIFRDAFRAFMRKEVVPFRDKFLEQGFVDRQIWKKAGDRGFLLPSAPEALGGLGLSDFRYEQIMAEEMGFCGESGALFFLHNTIAAPYILKFGSDALKSKFLPAAISGDAILGIAMTEPDFGSNLAGMRTTAVEKQDHYLLNGSKVYISNGIVGDIFVVAARTGGEEHKALSLFVVEANSKGFERSKLKKMGMHSQDTALFNFQDVQIPKENLLGEKGRGFYYLMGGLDEERLICAIWNWATAEYAFSETLSFVKERKVFDQPVSSYQNTQFTMAGLRARLDCVQAYLDRLVEDVIGGHLNSADASAAKLLCSELQGEVVDACFQFYGGAAFMDEYPISRLYADARITRVFAGTSEVMKMNISKALAM